MQITTPLTEEQMVGLRAGQKATISGVIYVARDAAHGKMAEALARGDPLPVELEGQIIYYMGPSPARPGRPIGSAGPTTSYRMDAWTPTLLGLGLRGMIGKGERSERVRQAIAEHGAAYFVAVGGAAALIAQTIRSARVVAYPELGPEALRELVVDEMPVIVAYDATGGDAFADGRAEYRIDED